MRPLQRAALSIFSAGATHRSHHVAADPVRPSRPSRARPSRVSAQKAHPTAPRRLAPGDPSGRRGASARSARAPPHCMDAPMSNARPGLASHCSVLQTLHKHLPHPAALRLCLPGARRPWVTTRLHQTVKEEPGSAGARIAPPLAAIGAPGLWCDSLRCRGGCGRCRGTAVRQGTLRCARAGSQHVGASGAPRADSLTVAATHTCAAAGSVLAQLHPAR